MRAQRTDHLTIPEFVLEDDPNCATVDPELFFPQETEYINGSIRYVYKNLAAAKKVCEPCPLKMQCLEFALKNGEFGIWGGTTEEQRRNLRRRFKLGKIPRYKTPISW